METVTYLLGAGASAQCLPVVNQMAEGIIKTNKLLFDNVSRKDIRGFIVNNKYLAEVQNELRWLNKICSEHYSIDTYAKKIYLKDDEEEYIKLKNILSLYFTIQQKLVLPDKRYDNFWASILDEKDKFPNHLRIISWNYDSQLELSYKNFVSSSISLEEAYSRIRMSSFYDEKLISPDGFGIFKLNGSIKKVGRSQGKRYTKFLVDNFNFGDNLDFFEKLYESYDAMKLDGMKTKDEQITNELSFAWEHDFDKPFYENMKASVYDTKILVVIGYSFPFFNRKLDKRIINDYMPYLQKVYFQAPDAENIQERFFAITRKVSEANMFLRKDENQFAFPNELDL